MKILLCLLSDQHVPNLLSVHHFRPDELVLIESEGMRRKSVAAHFLAALKSGGLDYDSRHHVQPLASEDDLARVRAALEESYGRFSSGDWIANVTGGTKPMSIATYEFFTARGGKTIYTNLGQPDRITNLETGVVEICTHRPSIDEFVTGYGFHLQKPAHKLAEAKTRSGQPLWRKTASLLAARESVTDVVSLDDKQREQSRKKGIELPSERFTLPKEVRDEWLGGKPSRKLDKDEGEFLTGGWLEVFFFNLLTQHQDALSIWDVTLGHNITRDLGANAVPNDIDVSFMHNHGMAMLECKSGTQEQDTTGGMYDLYKTETVKMKLGALRARSFYATTGANVLDDEQNTVRDSFRRRAGVYNCTILTRKEIRELAALERADSPETVSRIKTLFGL